MTKYILFFVLSISFLVSCKNDVKVNEVKSETVKKVKEPVSKDVGEDNSDRDLATLFNPCSLITREELGEIFSIPAANLEIKNSGSSGTFSESCFLRWERVENGSSSSMFLILQTDPLPGDFEDWAKSFIESKRTSGDIRYPDSDKPYKYKIIDGFDDEVAYNDDLRKVFWKVNEDYVCAIFFNAGLTSHNRKLYSAEIAKIMSKNLKKKL